MLLHSYHASISCHASYVATKLCTSFYRLCIGIYGRMLCIANSQGIWAMIPCGGTAKPGYEACCWSEVAGKYIYICRICRLSILVSTLLSVIDMYVYSIYIDMICYYLCKNERYAYCHI